MLLTGATGFIGQRLWPALERAGHQVRGLTRDPHKARRTWPGREWVGGDLEGEDDLSAIVAGRSAAFSLAHGMSGGADYRQREVRAAERFARAAVTAGMQRIVYLGGLAPSGVPLEHLRSRFEVGELLRAGPVPTLDLRASVIVGAGSLSWLILRDLAARLPAMVLPRWLRSRTQPVAVGDVIAALVAGLGVPLPAAASFDLPGPEVLAGRAMLELTARALHLKPPIMVEVPLLTPWLSSHWVRFVTRADWSIARELGGWVTGQGPGERCAWGAW